MNQPAVVQPPTLIAIVVESDPAGDCQVYSTFTDGHREVHAARVTIDEAVKRVTDVTDVTDALTIIDFRIVDALTEAAPVEMVEPPKGADAHA